MKNTILVVALAWLGFIALDPDGSVWRERGATRAQWAAALVACANGRGFVIGNRAVLCYVADVTEVGDD